MNGNEIQYLVEWMLRHEFSRVVAWGFLTGFSAAGGLDVTAETEALFDAAWEEAEEY